MKRVVISGATGAIGMALIEKLMREDIDVTVLCRKNSSRRNRLDRFESINVLEYGLDEYEDLIKEISFEKSQGKHSYVKEPYDVFYHMAWESTFGEGRNDVFAQIKNIEYTNIAVELAHALGCKKFIGLGSQAEFGRYEGRLNSTIPCNPDNGYGIAKLAAGQLSRIRCQQLGMEHIWTRVLSVYGPYDGEKTLVSTLINDFSKGISPSCTKGEQIWDYIYSKDAAKALFLLGLAGVSGKTYCIGNGVGRPLKEYIETIKEVVNPAIEVKYGDIPYSDKQVMHLVADISDLVEDTGYACDYAFCMGIKDMISCIE